MSVTITAGYLAEINAQSTEITALCIPAEEASNRTTLWPCCLRMLCISITGGHFSGGKPFEHSTKWYTQRVK